MRSHRYKSVGIKDLKDQASEIIASVQKTGRSISITKFNQEVARIVPISNSAHERLVASGLLPQGPKPKPLSELRLKPMRVDSTPAVKSILKDREEDE